MKNAEMRYREVGQLRFSSVLTGSGPGGQDGGPPFANRQGGRNSGKNNVSLVLKTMESFPGGDRRVVPQVRHGDVPGSQSRSQNR
jgi:hypothetical protein